MHLTIPLCPSAGKMLLSVIELDHPVDPVVETLLEVEQPLEVVQPPARTQVPVSLPDQHTAPSSLCVAFPNSLDPKMYIVLAHPRALEPFEKVLYHFLS